MKSTEIRSHPTTSGYHKSRISLTEGGPYSRFKRRIARRIAAILLIVCGMLSCLPVSAQRNFRWTAMKTADVADVTVDLRGTPWVTRRDQTVGYITTYGSSDHFNQIPASGFSRVTMGDGSTLWAVGANGTLWSYGSDGWKELLWEGVADVAWGPWNGRNPSPWVIGQDGTVRRTWDGENFHDSRTPDGGARSMAFAGTDVFEDYVTWTIGMDGSLSWWSSYEGRWIFTGTGGMSDIAIGPDGTIWLVDQSGNLRFTKNGYNPVPIAVPEGVNLHVEHIGDILGVGGHAPARPVRTTWAGFRRIAARPFLLSDRTGRHAVLWVVGNNGSLWRLDYDL